MQLAPYDQNSEEDSRTRFHGPELVGSRLFMYGDDNSMHCYDTATAAWCPGYPLNTALAGVHDMPLAGATFADGVDSDDGQQFDMLTLPDGRIFTTLTPADGATWIGCWNTATAGPCGGWPLTSTADGRPWLFAHYDTFGNINGVCARGGNRGGDEVGQGHECFAFDGTSLGSPLPFNFETSGSNKAGQQSATVVCLPELCITGYGCEDAFHAAGVHEMAARVLAEIVPNTEGIVVSIGLPVLHGGGLFNAAALVAD